VATGGSAITSYVVYWDQGLGGGFSILTGDPTPNTSTNILVTSGISSGTTYKFKYLARNAHGDSGFSPEVSIIAATVPGSMAAPTVAYTSLAYRVTFVEPANTGGSGIAI